MKNLKLNTSKLLLAMANACITTTNLAEKSNVSRVAITRFTTGKSNPKPQTIGKIAKALNVKVEELIEDETYETS
jgi:transcriptional regulator with XRE-family HTH domain